MKKLLLSFGITCLLASCAPVIYTTMVSKDFEGQKPSNASLCIAPFRNMVVDYNGSVTEEFGKGNQQQLIINHFTSTLSSNLKERSTFASVTFDTPTVPLSFKRFNFDIGDKLTLDLPADTPTIAFKQGVPDFILFIQDLKIGTEDFDADNIGYKVPEPSEPSDVQSTSNEQETRMLINGKVPVFGYSPPVFYSPTPMAPVYQPPKDKYLRYTCGFAFWDNRKHSPAVYGRIMARSRSESHVLGMVQIIKIANWNEVDEKFITYLLKGTPFAK